MYLKFLLLFMMLLVFPAHLLASPQGDYLQQLSTEANNTGNFNSQAQNQNESVRQRFIALETLLKNQRPAFYKFYTKLSDDKKEKVLEIHNEQQMLSVTSQMIADLYFK